MESSKLPLGILRHCVAALDVAKSDIHEAIEDEDITEEDRQDFEYISNIIGDIMATIVNKTNQVRRGDGIMFTAQEDKWYTNRTLLAIYVDRNIRSGSFVYGELIDSTDSYITIRVYEKEYTAPRGYERKFVKTNRTAMIARESISIFEEVDMSKTLIE